MPLARKCPLQTYSASFSILPAKTEGANRVVRLTLIDLIIPVVWFSVISVIVAPSLLPDYPFVSKLVLVATVPGYIALIPFVYRKFGLPPMLLPRCACCGQWGDGFHVLADWPRVTHRCFKCEGEFVVWLDGKVGSDETWEVPVLVLKWPYVFGPYRKVEKPKPPT